MLYHWGRRDRRSLSPAALVAPQNAGLSQQLRESEMRNSVLTLICAAGLAMSSAAAFAEGMVQLKPDAPDSYKIGMDDSVIEVATKYVEDPAQFKTLLANGRKGMPKAVHNPHTVLPRGAVLLLRRTGGKPSLTVAGGDTQTYVKLSPGMTEVTEGYNIPLFPMRFIRNFMSYPKVMEKEEIDKDPTIIAGPESRILFTPGDVIYTGELEHTGRYLIYTVKGDVLDPDTKKSLGKEIVFVGEAKTKEPRSGQYVDRTNMSAEERAYLPADERYARLRPLLKTPAKVARALEITKMVGNISQGDKLLYQPENTYERMNFEAHEPLVTVRGKVANTLEELNFSTDLRTIAINRGKRHGLDKGALLSVYREKDPTRIYRRKNGEPTATKLMFPVTKVSNLILYEVGENVSHGLLFGSQGIDVRVGDIVANAGMELSDIDMPAENVPDWLVDVYGTGEVSESTPGTTRQAF